MTVKENLGQSDDWNLLVCFAGDRSEPAFAELMRRHLDMVYAAALRDVREHALADDVTQATFLLLARKASSLRPARGQALAGWLFSAARFVARDALRAQARRRRHEREAAMNRLGVVVEANDLESEHLTPFLNSAVASLGAKDRDAVVLRFFENRSHREVGAALGVSEDAAKVRIARALEKLRKKLSRQAGTQAGVTALSGALASHALVHAPPSTAAGISTLLVGQAPSHVLALAEAARRAMAWMKVKVAVIATAVVIVGAGVFAILKNDSPPDHQPAAPVAPSVMAVTQSPLAPPAPSAPAAPRICQWMAVVDSVMFEQISAAATPVPSVGKQYTGYTIDSGTLADRLRASLDSEHVRYLSPRLKWSGAGGFGYGGDFIALQTGDALYSTVTNGNGTSLLERTRGGEFRLTLDYSSLIYFGGELVNLNDKFHFQSVVKPEQAVMAIAPAMKLGVEQLYHVVVWQIGTSANAVATTEWIGAKASEEPPVFQPVTAMFSPLVTRSGERPSGASATLLEIRRTGPLGNERGGLVQYEAQVQLAGLPVRPGSYVPSFAVWNPASSIGAANVEWRRENRQRQAVGVVTTQLPGFRTTASLRFGVAMGQPREIGALRSSDVGRSLRIDPHEDEKFAACIELVKVEPAEVSAKRSEAEPKMAGTNVVARSVNVGLRYNVEMTAIDIDGKAVEFRGMQRGGGRQTPQWTWSTSFAAPPERIGELRFSVQPIEWADFEDVPLLPSRQVSKAPAPPIPATTIAAPIAAKPVTTVAVEKHDPDSPEAFVIAFQQALRAGDPSVLRAMVHAETPLQRAVAELTMEQLAARAELSRAAVEAFGNSEAEAARLATMEGASQPATPFKIDGDIATRLVESHVQVGGPSQLRQIEGRWKLNFTATHLDEDPTKNQQAQRWLESAKPEVKAMIETAKEIRDGKHETGRDAAAALKAKRRGG